MSGATATTRDVGCLAPVWAQGRLTVFPGTLQTLCLREPDARHDCEPPPVPTRLAIAMLRPGWEASRDPALAPIYPQVCLARVMYHAPLAPGRRLLLVRGVCRAEIVRDDRFELGRRVALVRRLRDVVPRDPSIDRFHRRAELLDLAGRLVPPAARDMLAEVFRQERPLGNLCDIVSHSLPLDRHDALALLGTLNIDLRSDLLLDALRRQVRLRAALPRSFPPSFGCN
jgi:Lon protease-like protein